MKQGIVFVQMEHKTSQNGKNYTRFKTNQGKWISCFEELIVDKVKPHLNKMIEVEIVENNGFSNLRGFNRVLSNEHIEEIKPQAFTGTSTSANTGKKDTTFYVSYAKDIYIAFLGQAAGDIVHEELTKKVISIVKELKEAFE